MATFDYPTTESSKFPYLKPTDRSFVFYYTLENTTDVDYRLPSEVELDVKLKREKSLVDGDKGVSLDKGVFIPAKHRTTVAVHFGYAAPHGRDYNPDTPEGRQAIENFLSGQLANLNGFVLFDSTKRYEINFPADWAKKQ